MKIVLIISIVCSLFSCSNQEKINVEESRMELAEPDKDLRIGSEINDALNAISSEITSSDEIETSKSGYKIITSDSSILPYLKNFFPDSVETKIWSVKQRRLLKKGEVAIILADHIKKIPIAQVVGVQNCIPPFDFEIENYLWAIESDPVGFRTKYIAWLREEN